MEKSFEATVVNVDILKGRMSHDVNRKMQSTTINSIGYGLLRNSILRPHISTFIRNIQVR